MESALSCNLVRPQNQGALHMMPRRLAVTLLAAPAVEGAPCKLNCIAAAAPAVEGAPCKLDRVLMPPAAEGALGNLVMMFRVV